MSRKEDLENKISYLENRIDNLKRMIGDQEYKNDGYREELRVIQTQINDYHERNYNEWISNQNEWIDDLGEYAKERGEYWDNRQQIRFYDKELKEVPLNNLKEGERLVRSYKRELAGLHDELHRCEDELGRARSVDDEAYSYEGGPELEEDDYAAGDDNEDNYDEDEDDYETNNVVRPRPDTKQPLKIVIRPSVKKDAYTSRRQALQEYAQKSKKSYSELPAVSGGYKAAVGDTIYDYRNEDDLVITSRKGVPGIDDFKAILQAERQLGRTVLPLGKIESPEYRARLVVACDDVGIKPVGDIRVKESDLGKLGIFTRVKYQKFIERLDKSVAAARASLAAMNKKSR